MEFWLQHLHTVGVTRRVFSLNVRPTEFFPLTCLAVTSSETVPCRLVRRPGEKLVAAPFVTPVFLIRSIAIAPLSSCLVNGVSSSAGVESAIATEMLFEPDFTGALEPLKSPSAMVLPVDGCVPVLLHNPTSKYVRCRAGQLAGHLSIASIQATKVVKMAVHPTRVAQISVSTPTTRFEASNEPVATQEAIELTNGVKIDLTTTIPLDPSQRKKLHAMLQRNIAVFADNP